MSVELFSDQAIIDKIDIQPKGKGWISVSDDPYFILSIPPISKLGWYKFKLTLDANVGAKPRLYFDFGLNFNELYSSDLTSIGGNQFETLIRLENSPSRIRFDPINAIGRFTVHTLSIEYVSPVKFWVFAAAKAIKMMAKNPVTNFKRLWVTGTSLLKPQTFRSVSPEIRDASSLNSYARWRIRYDYDPDVHRDGILSVLETLDRKPLISVVMPVYNTPTEHLNAAIQSVFDQLYPNWELCICDDGSSDPHVRAELDRWAAKDTRIKLTYRKKNGHIVKATNAAFKLGSGEWTALMDHDDVLSENALAELVITINRDPDCQIIYSDEDKLDENEQRVDPHFKPEFSPELFRSMNYLNHLTAYRTAQIHAVGGWQDAYLGSQDYDLTLRIWERIDDSQIIHIPKILYHWRKAAGSTALSGEAKTYAVEAGRKALETHLKRLDISADVAIIPDLPFYRIQYAITPPLPLVSLIIPTKDKAELLRQCVSSITEKTHYPNYEILIVDNNSQSPETIAFFEELKSHKNIRVIKFDAPFNFSAINNFAVEQAKGDIMGLINNDIQIISDGWLTEMVSWAQQDRIGCVGAKLYYANDLIQHAGVIVGLGGVAGHSHKYFPRDAPGYFNRLQVCQNFSAVTAACLLIRKSIYQSVGSLNETDLAVAYNDVDLGLKARAAGYVNVWTPFAEAYHYESLSRGTDSSPEKARRYKAEVDYMLKTWGGDLAADPYYSPHLSPHLEDFSLKE